MKLPTIAHRGIRRGSIAVVASLLLAAVGTVFESAAPAQAATNTLKVHVVAARTEPLALGGAGVTAGDPVADFEYIINEDNTGTTEQRSPADGCSPADSEYPASCNWTSIAGAATSSPIVTQGDQDDFAAGVVLPNGRYLVSVLADGFKIDGAHFTVPLADPGVVTVEVQPTPLPDSTIQAAVFEDTSIVNGAPDLPAEHGLAGFQGHIKDYLGEVTTDVYGDPLCGDGICLSECYVVDSGVDIGTVEPLDAAGRCPNDPTGLSMVGGGAVPATAAIEGKLIIPNLGTDRYALSITAPDGTAWTQTTTLEGNHDWDSWVMEGATGLDTEFVLAGEPFPAVFFGYVQATGPLAAGPTGHVKGVIVGVKAYVPGVGGVFGEFGLTGAKVDKPIPFPWIALNDLDNGDTAVFIGRGDANGAFDIANVPDGTYTMTWWDEPQDYILQVQNITVTGGEIVDVGLLQSLGWWAQFEGYVFNDTNRNGVMDWHDTDGDGCPDPGEGERGVANFGLTMRKRENSLMDRGATAVSTDACGRYFMENAYPMTQWLVMEAYSDLFYTTGYTYQSDNQPTPTTILGAGVDVSVLPIIGLGGRLDWGVHAYDPAGVTGGVDPRNGGIVGTVSYDTTRNELDPRYAAVEDWQPGVPGLTVDLYSPVACGTNAGNPCDETERYELDADGSLLKGQQLNTYVTETWQRPGLNDDGACVPRNVDGDRLAYPADQQVTASDTDCLEGPLMGIQFQSGFSTVDGNYGFADGCFAPNHLDPAAPPDAPICLDAANQPVDFAPLPGGRDYLVDVEIPNDDYGRPMYTVTKEEDINIGEGDEIIPQVPPPACAGALHTVDVADAGTDNYPPVTLPNGIVVPASSPVANPTFVDIGGSPYEGEQRPTCGMKLVPLANGRSIVPTFNVFTDVPIPGRFWGLLVDDLNFSADPQSLLFGEKQGIAFAPVGIYDYANHLVATTESDYNGLFDVLLPSTNRISCPTPSGVCPNLYRFVGNDPGVPGALNPNYRPEFRTIAAEFEAFPGLLVPADLAPHQVGVSVQLPGGQVNRVTCALAPTTPQLFAVNRPYVSSGSNSLTISGLGFGATQGAGSVALDGTAITVTAWSDTTIAATVPAAITPGARQLMVTAGNGQRTVSGITIHVLGSVAAPAFPATPVLDNFNRANNANIGPNWSALDPGFSINTNQLQEQALLGVARSVTWVNGTAPGANQEGRFTITDLGPTGTEYGVVLKSSGLLNEIRVVHTGTTVQIRTRAAPSLTFVTQASFPAQPSPAVNEVLGARSAADGTVTAYRNGAAVGSVNVTTTANPWPATLNTAGGRIGIYVQGGTAANFVRLDDFGGGNFTPPAGTSYTPNLYEVGPTSNANYTAAKASAGRWFTPANSLPAVADHAIQNALDAAAASPGNDLVVVYPGPDTAATNPRLNPRGAYYENLLVYTPVKLQGVGPGGLQGSTVVRGSVLDGGAFGGDSPVAGDWLDKLATLTWDGTQDVNDGAVITLLAQANTFGAAFPATIDGFDIRGGDQAGFPTNINEVGGTPTGLPPAVVTQGGAVFANAYVQNLRVTNNTVDNNGGGYGTIRIGTPNLPAPNTSNHNENIRILNNRVIANGGTNLAGGIGVFAGADGYEIADNDICGNFSAEYGGGVSVFGLSPNGRIHRNRIWFNRSYDEGAGIMVAGELPANPAALSPGSGPVDIYDNLVQGNLALDDGGGIRLLMVGNVPINVYNNMVVNNVSTHEGGGIAIDDGPNVRVFDNTVMKNITTATAVTSNGTPAPAGLSTGRNSGPLQATLPAGSPVFSDPLLFNNVFWDNRAGSRAANGVTGVGVPGDASPINNWDMGAADGSGVLSPTNSVLQTTLGTNPSASNSGADPAVVRPYDVSVGFNAWRTNVNFIGAILVAVEVPPNLLGDYHVPTTSSAVNRGAASKAGVNAPTTDYDGDARPGAGGLFDAGADEVVSTAPPFPAAAVLDNFNRANGALGANWAGTTAQTRFRVNANSAQALGVGGAVWWNAGAAFGASQEAYMTLTAIGASTSTLTRTQGLLLKSNGVDPATTGGQAIEVRYVNDTTAAPDRVEVRTKLSGGSWTTVTTITSATFATGNQLGARVRADGTLTVYQNGIVVGTANVGATLAAATGRIGASYSISDPANVNQIGRFDDFGGGNAP